MQRTRIEELVGSKHKIRKWKTELPGLIGLGCAYMLRYCTVSHKNVQAFYANKNILN